MPPTNTPVPPTDIPVPPTNTPVTASCSDITAGSAHANGSDFSFDIDNGYNKAIQLDQISISWPGSNGGLLRIKLGKNEMWSGSIAPSAGTIDLTGVNKGLRTIAQGKSGTITFSFENDAASSGYNINIDTNVDCNITFSH
jgi:hypothetical protein